MSSLWLGSEKLKPNDTIAPVINQGTLGIGFIGLAECLVALTGKHHGEDAASQELGLKIVSYIRNRANQFSEEYQHNYSVLATPAEGLSGKFTRRDRKKFGSLPGITDRDYYTNSNHVPVYYKCSARHKAEVEAPYHEMTRGGHIFYVEMDGDATHNPEVIMQVVDMMDRYNIGYGSSTTIVTAASTAATKMRKPIWRNVRNAAAPISTNYSASPVTWSVRQIAGTKRNWQN